MYDKEYFIKKFTAIPNEEIGQGELKNQCALFHCGVTLDNNGMYQHTEESRALCNILGGSSNFSNVWNINDIDDYDDTPKERILNALNNL